MNRRYLLWLLPMVLVRGLDWYTSDENWWEFEAQSAWRDRIAVLEAESQNRYQELRAWADGLYKAANPNRDIADMLNGGQDAFRWKRKLTTKSLFGGIPNMASRWILIFLAKRLLRAPACRSCLMALFG